MDTQSFRWRFNLRYMMGFIAIVALILAVSSQVGFGTGVFFIFGIGVGLVVAKLARKSSCSYVLKLCLGMLFAIICELPVMIIVAVLNLPPIWIWMLEHIMIWILAAAVGGLIGVLVTGRKFDSPQKP